MIRRRVHARAVLILTALALFSVGLTACDAESAADLANAVSDIYESVSKKSVIVSQDEWYYGHRHEFSPDAWKGEAVLDLGAPGFSLSDLSMAGTYADPVVETVSVHKIRSVTALLGPGDIGAGLFQEPVQADMAGYRYDAAYPGIVPGNLFVQAPMVPSGGEARCLATRYAWKAGLEPVFSDLAAYLADGPESGILWRMTCVYSGVDDMPCGFLLEYQSMDGELAGCKYVYNIQPGIGFDYLTGRNWIAAAGDPEAGKSTETGGDGQ